MEPRIFSSELAKTIDDAINQFSDSIPAIQKKMLNDVVNQIKGLETTNDGSIVNSVNNLKVIADIKAKLQDTMLNNSYLRSVKSFTDAFQEVSDLNASYFSTIEKQFQTSPLLKQIQKMSIDATINSLTEAGLEAYVTTGIAQLLQRNITSGGSFASLQEQLGNYITGNQGSEGALQRYTKQITTDALNQYSANYIQTVSSDLGLDWFMYTGSNIKTTREFCEHLTEKLYIHRSELSIIITGDIDGFQCRINPKTKLWYGAIPDTNTLNFQVNRGGFNCGHQLIPVMDGVVPKDKLDVQDQFEQFDKISGMDPEMNALQDKSIRYYLNNSSELLKEYLNNPQLAGESGNIVNTDNARRLFASIGYNGKNAIAFHEAASAVAKDVTMKLIDEDGEGNVTLYAGSAGSGKTSAIDKILPDITGNTDLVLDGNLSSYATAIKRIDYAISSGETVRIVYVWRDPIEAFRATIDRTLNNEAEGGRIVPISAFIKTLNSLDTMKRLLNGTQYGDNLKIDLINNANGRGNASFMNVDELDKITIPDNLASTLKNIALDLFKEGTITEDQYQAIIL